MDTTAYYPDNDPTWTEAGNDTVKTVAWSFIPQNRRLHRDHNNLCLSHVWGKLMIIDSRKAPYITHTLMYTLT